MNGQSQPTKNLKVSFYSICLMYEMDEYALQLLATLAKVDDSVVERMFVDVAVKRVEADQVLEALSRFKGETWNITNVRVALMPTFGELHTIHNFNLDTLAKDAGVPYAVLDMMLTGHAVSRRDARLVLQMASRLASKIFTFETVDIPLLETGD